MRTVNLLALAGVLTAASFGQSTFKQYTFTPQFQLFPGGCDPNPLDPISERGARIEYRIGCTVGGFLNVGVARLTITHGPSLPPLNANPDGNPSTPDFELSTPQPMAAEVELAWHHPRLSPGRMTLNLGFGQEPDAEARGCQTVTIVDVPAGVTDHIVRAAVTCNVTRAHGGEPIGLLPEDRVVTVFIGFNWAPIRGPGEPLPLPPVAGTQLLAYMVYGGGDKVEISALSQLPPVAPDKLQRVAGELSADVDYALVSRSTAEVLLDLSYEAETANGKVIKPLMEGPSSTILQAGTGKRRLSVHPDTIPDDATQLVLKAKLVTPTSKGLIAESEAVRYDLMPNVKIDRIEYVQTSQDRDGSVPMVFGRDFVQRVFPKNFAPFGPAPEVFVHSALQLGSDCLPPVWPYGPLAAQRQPDRAGSDAVALPIPWECLGKNMGVRLETPEKRPIGAPEEGRFPSGVHVRQLAVQYAKYCQTGALCPEDVAGNAIIARTLLPGNLRYIPVPGEARYTEDLTKPSHQTDLLLKLAKRWLAIQGERPDQLIAWIPRSEGVPLAMSGRQYGPVGLIQDRREHRRPDESDPEVIIGAFLGDSNKGALESQALLMQTIAVNLGLPRAQSGSSCATIGDPGWDLETRRLVPPNTPDVMGNCLRSLQGPWVSADTAKRLIDALRTSAPSAAAPKETQRHAVANYFLVSGAVPKTGASTIDPLLRLATENAASDATPNGEYCLRFANATQTLSSFCFNLSYDYEGAPLDIAKFVFQVSDPGGVTRVLLDRNGQQIAQLVQSANPPTVNFTSPQSGTVWNEGEKTISFTGNDADGDTLQYALSYSSDGVNWIPLETGTTETQFAIDPSALVGGANVRFRVQATDGLNTATAEVGPINVQQTARFDASRSEVRFPSGLPGDGTYAEIRVGNTGTGPLRITAASFSSSQFKLVSDLPFEVPAGATLGLRMRFAVPETAGETAANVTLTTNDPSAPQVTIPLRGKSVTTARGEIVVPATSLDFGTVTVGESTTRTLVIQNYGAGKLTITAIGSNQGVFTLGSLTLPLELATEQVIIPVTFRPLAAGAVTGRITITSNDPDRPSIQVNLTGTGAGGGTGGPTPSINNGGVVDGASFRGTLTRGGIASIFGNELAGGTLAASTVPLPKTLGGVQVLVNGVAAPLYFVAAGQINFQVPFDVALTGSIRVRVTRNGVQSAEVNVPVAPFAPGIFMISGAPIAVHLDGSLVSASRPANLDELIVLFLTGLGDLTSTPPTGDRAPTSPLAEARQLPTVMIGGLPAQVLFAGMTPGFIGLAQLNLKVPAGLNNPNRAAVANMPMIVSFGSAQTQPLDLAVEGAVLPSKPTIAVDPTSLAFGNVTIGQTRDLAFTVRNTGGASLTVNSLAVNSSRYSVVSPAAPFNVAANGSQTVTLRFTPNVSGAASGAITIASNDASRPSVVVSLSGTGVNASAPGIEVTPLTLDFTTVTLGQSKDLQLSIRNTGSAALTVLSMTSTNARFIVSAPTAPFNIAAGASQSVTVDFEPLAAGIQSGTLSIAHNASSQPVTVALVGTGVSGELTISVGQTVNGTLQAGDERSLGCPNCYADVYKLVITTPQTVQVRLNSTAFDPFLRVLNAQQQMVGEDDDGGVGLNAALEGTLPPGIYYIEATSAFANESGAYTLSVTLAP